MTRARSLSLLANTNALTVDANQNVGIGSTIPDARLDVDGDMNVSGTLTYEDVTNVETAGITTTGGLVVTGLGATIGGITTFFGNLNFGGAGVGGTVTTLGHAEFAGVVTATSFSGDGSGLTGVASTDNINTSTLAQFTGGVGIADSIFHIEDSNTAIRFPAADTFTVETAGSERVRIDSAGRMGLGVTPPTGYGSGRTSLDIHSSGATVSHLALTNSTTGSNGSSNGFNIIQSALDTLLFLRESGNMSFSTANAERLRITSGGEVVVNGTATGSNAKFEVQSTTGSISSATLRVSAEKTTTGAINTGSTILLAGHDGGNSRDFGSIFAGKENGTGSDYDAYLAFGTRSNGSALAERLRIDSSGRTLIGNTQDSAPFSWGLGLQVSGTSTNAGLSIRRDQNSSGGALLMFVKSRGSLNGNTVVQDGDQIGGMYFNAADGTDVNSYAAQIAAEIDGTPGSNDVPGRLIFKTTADGASSPTERLRIGSSGQIGLGGANYGTSGQVLTSNGSGSAVTWEDASGGGGITTQVGNASGIVTSMFLTDATDHKITATGICTITTTQAGTEGQSHTIRIVNSGSATVGFSTYFLFPSGSTPSLPTADGAVSLISFTVHDSVGAGCTQLLAGASVNFS